MRARLLLIAVLPLLASAVPAFAEEAEAPETAFRGEMKRAIETMKAQCGIDLEVRADFSRFDAAQWTASSKRPSRAASPGGVCASAVEGIYELCGPPSGPGVWREVIARELKAIDCTPTGYRPPDPDDRSTDGPVRRNLSYDAGVLRFHVHPDFGNVGQNSQYVLMRALVNKPGAPKGVKLSGDHLENGERCTARSQCTSQVCAAGVCRACTAKSGCAPGYLCERGICWSKAAIADSAAHANDCKPKGKPCDGDAECCSKSCPSSKVSQRGWSKICD